MVEASVNEILSGSIHVSGHRIYAIYDRQRRCIYVGYTKNLKTRMRQHLRNKSEWQEYFDEDDDPRVIVYDHEDVNEIALARESDIELRVSSDEEKWAKAAEWYMCKVLRPYINRRKTYKPEINDAITLARYGDFDRDTAYQHAVQVLRDWNVTNKRFDEEELAIKRKLGLA
jgi:predicted GIY-YIG superfamily endonuclease